jgi:hypothetical protein
MERISRDVLVDIQKQIHRGEEAYYEETNNRGNLFRGWDTFVDSKEIGIVNATSVPQGTRRIPADYRWFASSCKSLSRPARPPSVLKQSLSRPPSANSSSIPLPTPSSAALASNPDPSQANSFLAENVASSKVINAADTGIKVEVAKEQEATGDAKEVENQSAVPAEKDSNKEHSSEDEPTKKISLETSSKRKTRDDDEQGSGELAEPSPKSANTADEKDKSISVDTTIPDKDGDGPVDSKGEEKMDIDEDDESSGKVDTSKEKGDDDTAVKSTSAKKEDGPRKRRSSRNRK